MPKPLILPNWSTDLNYPAGTQPEAGTATKVAPTSGQATIGWRPNAIPTAQEQNHWMNVVYQWCDWINAGILEGVSLTLSGTLSVGGTSTLTGAVTAAAGVTAGANQNIVVSGTGRIVHGLRTRTIPLVPTGIVTGGTTSANTGEPGSVQAAGVTAYYPLGALETYEKLTGVEVMSKDSNNSTTYSLVVGGGYGVSVAFSADIAGTLTTSDAENPSMIPTTAVTQGAGLSYYLKVVTGGAGVRQLVCAVVSYRVDA